VSVYIDPLMNHGWKLGPSCHMWADTADELHGFASRIGLRRAWFQSIPKPGGYVFPHYDLTASRRAAAVLLGAMECDRRQAVASWTRLGYRPERRPVAPAPADAGRV
jgi:hypothetical protein